MEKNNTLEIKDFNLSFGPNVIFEHFDYVFEKGIYVLSGPSGSGKSTLMRAIAGLETRYTGDIMLNGEEILKPSPERHMMHQGYFSFPWCNLLKNALMVYKGHKIKPTEEDVEEAKAILKRLGLEEHMDKLPGQISGGQDQRLSFASAMLNKWSPVVLYDEPTSALDNVNDDLVVDMIREHQEKYGTIEIIITHEEHVVKRLEPTILDFTPEFRIRPAKQKPVSPLVVKAFRLHAEKVAAKKAKFEADKKMDVTEENVE